jgi:hypothetical protein
MADEISAGDGGASPAPQKRKASTVSSPTPTAATTAGPEGAGASAIPGDVAPDHKKPNAKPSQPSQHQEQQQQQVQLPTGWQPTPGYFYRRKLPVSSIRYDSPQGMALFGSSFAAGCANAHFHLMAQFHTQTEPSYCGLGTLAMMLNALAIDPKRVWKGVWRWFDETLLDCCKPLNEVMIEGINLEEFVCLARCNGASAVLVRPNLASVSDGVLASAGVLCDAAVAGSAMTTTTATTTAGGGGGGCCDGGSGSSGGGGGFYGAAVAADSAGKGGGNGGAAGDGADGGGGCGDGSLPAADGAGKSGGGSSCCGGGGGSAVAATAASSLVASSSYVIGSEEHFRAVVRRVMSQPVDKFTEAVAISYNRRVLSQSGDGHFSPVGACRTCACAFGWAVLASLSRVRA